MGYVVIASAACLLRDGHQVFGVDPIESKVRDMSHGNTPFQEAGAAGCTARPSGNSRAL